MNTVVETLQWTGPDAQQLKQFARDFAALNREVEALREQVKARS